MPELKAYDPADWYWFVGFTSADDPVSINLDAEPAWSSARGATVAAADPAYAAWRAAGNVPTRIAGEVELVDVLERAGHGDGAPDRVFTRAELTAALRRVDPARAAGLDQMTDEEIALAAPSFALALPQTRAAREARALADRKALIRAEIAAEKEGA